RSWTDVGLIRFRHGDEIYGFRNALGDIADRARAHPLHARQIAENLGGRIVLVTKLDGDGRSQHVRLELADAGQRRAHSGLDPRGGFRRGDRFRGMNDRRLIGLNRDEVRSTTTYFMRTTT